MTRPVKDRPIDAAPVDDGDLLVRHRHGDREAFPALVQRYRGMVFSYLVRCGVDAGTRDDLFQEVFLRIHRAAHTYDDKRALRPWILTITANTVRSHFRATREEVPGSDAALESRPDLVPDAFDLTAARETATWLEAAIRKLPLPQREAVTLCCVEQLPQEVAAEILGTPLNTVKTNLRRARLALAQGLTLRNTRLRREGPS